MVNSGQEWSATPFAAYLNLACSSEMSDSVSESSESLPEQRTTSSQTCFTVYVVRLRLAGGGIVKSN